MQSEFLRNLSLFFVLLGAGLTALMAGCTRPLPVEQPVTALPYQDQVIQIACPAESIEGLLQRFAPAWAKKTGAQVKIVPYARGSAPPTTDVSAWIIRPAELPRWAEADQLTPVPAEYRAPSAAYHWTGLLSLYRDKLLRWREQVYGLPLVGDAVVCCYRADLFADPGHRQAFQEKYHRELSAPRTWEEFADIAEYFYSKRTKDKQAPSLPPLPQDAEALDYLFYAVAAPFARRAVYQDQRVTVTDEELFSFHYSLTSGEPRIAQPGFVHALQLLQKLQRFRHSEASATPDQAFADGAAVLTLATPAAISRFRKKLPAAGIGVCEVPGAAHWFRFRDGKERPAPGGGKHVPYLGAGGWIAVVPRTAPHADAAFALLTELSGRAISTQILSDPQWGGGPFREVHFGGDEQWYGFDLDRTMTGRLREAVHQTLARPGLKNSVVRLRIPDERAYQRALVEQVRHALMDGTDAAKALQTAAQRWRDLDKAKETQKRKNEYLLSLGLSPIS